jgi:hypothetical protein
VEGFGFHAETEYAVIDHRLAAALDLVFADLARCDHGMPTVTESDWVGMDDELGVMLTDADGMGRGVSIRTDLDDVENLVRVADQVQEFVHEHLQWFGGLPVAWPRCPDHPYSHPLDPVVAGAAVWRCPTTRRVIGAIGSLPAVPG